MNYKYDDEELECLDGYSGSTDCEGNVEYRTPLSGGRSFPRCDRHWAERLRSQEEFDARYPVLAPADFDPLYAGERWDDDY